MRMGFFNLTPEANEGQIPEYRVSSRWRDELKSSTSPLYLEIGVEHEDFFIAVTSIEMGGYSVAAIESHIKDGVKKAQSYCDTMNGRVRAANKLMKELILEPQDAVQFSED